MTPKRKKVKQRLNPTTTAPNQFLLTIYHKCISKITTTITQSPLRSLTQLWPLEVPPWYPVDRPSRAVRQVNHACGGGLKYLGANSGVDGVSNCVLSRLGAPPGGRNGKWGRGRHGTGDVYLANPLPNMSTCIFGGSVDFVWVVDGPNFRLPCCSSIQ